MVRSERGSRSSSTTPASRKGEAELKVERQRRIRKARSARGVPVGGRLRDECLGVELFATLLEARVVIEDWRIDYNTNRPHTAHGDLTPGEFATNWTTINQPQAA